MSKKHIAASASVGAAAPPLPARLLEILSALPMDAWVENSTGEILAQGNARVPRADMARPAPCPLHKNAGRYAHAPSVRRDAEHGTRDARAPQTTTYPLPPIKGCPRDLRLVTHVPDARENDCHVRVVSALLAQLLGEARHDDLPFTPQQRAVCDELSRGLSCKEIAYKLGISHTAVRIHLSRMRTRLGEGIIPRLRRRPGKSKRP